MSFAVTGCRPAAEGGIPLRGLERPIATPIIIIRLLMPEAARWAIEWRGMTTLTGKRPERPRQGNSGRSYRLRLFSHSGRKFRCPWRRVLVEMIGADATAYGGYRVDGRITGSANKNARRPEASGRGLC